MEVSVEYLLQLLGEAQVKVSLLESEVRRLEEFVPQKNGKTLVRPPMKNKRG
tara:strand:- start:620 stop:775 length:156 start_codon:yes stop_codon:yes gene_type:complete